MKKRLAAIVLVASTSAAVVGGVSAGLGPRHGARCAALHAKAAYWHQQAVNTEATDPALAAQYQNRSDNLEQRAANCDARGTTTTTATL